MFVLILFVLYDLISPPSKLPFSFISSFIFFFFYPILWERVIEMSFGADEYPGDALAHCFLLDHLPLTLTWASVQQS